MCVPMFLLYNFPTSYDLSENVLISKELRKSPLHKIIKEYKINNDPAKWIINDYIQEHVAIQGCNQNDDVDFTNSKKTYADESSRYQSKGLFKRKLLNGKEVRRSWLVF